jgi:two-component system, NtrC family, response regulator HydG
VRAKDLDLRELLDLDPARGVVRVAGQRVLILDAVAIGLLRKQLVVALGLRAARATLTRFGYAHGFRMAEAMRAHLPWDSDEELCEAGGFLHVLQGHICMEPGSTDPRSPQGATLASSYEVEQHVLHLGRADAPVCWILAGVASGYLSCATGKAVYVLEDRCIGKGDAACHFRARSLEEWGDEIKPHLPFYEEESLVRSLRRVTQEIRSAEEALRARRRAFARATGDDDEPSGVVAKSPGMRLVLDLARRVAKVDATVLITGESGAGKELLARLVHDESARAAAPFVAVNCAAISETLLESELFGHARGAFTGAAQDRPGLFEAAGGGTLFLDEIGETPPGMQAKLLRALEERRVRRVGENRSRPVNARILAATNRELSDEVAAGRFRKDLYYRLNVIELRVPPLRSRREDILPLSRALLARAAHRLGRPLLAGFTPRVADQLVRYGWPGNVRELANAMERAAILAQGKRVDVDDLPEDIRRAPPVPSPAGGGRKLADAEREHILAALAENDGNQTRTAAALGIGESTLYRKLRRYRTRV